MDILTNRVLYLTFSHSSHGVGISSSQQQCTESPIASSLNKNYSGNATDYSSFDVGVVCGDDKFSVGPSTTYLTSPIVDFYSW